MSGGGLVGQTFIIYQQQKQNDRDKRVTTSHCEYVQRQHSPQSSSTSPSSQHPTSTTTTTASGRSLVAFRLVQTNKLTLSSAAGWSVNFLYGVRSSTVYVTLPSISDHSTDSQTIRSGQSLVASRLQHRQFQPISSHTASLPARKLSSAYGDSAGPFSFC